MLKSGGAVGPLGQTFQIKQSKIMSPSYPCLVPNNFSLTSASHPERCVILLLRYRRVKNLPFLWLFCARLSSLQKNINAQILAWIDLNTISEPWFLLLPLSLDFPSLHFLSINVFIQYTHITLKLSYMIDMNWSVALLPQKRAYFILTTTVLVVFFFCSLGASPNCSVFAELVFRFWEEYIRSLWNNFILCSELL